MDDDFDLIENYNPEDETINFGTRIFSMGQDLHELVTLCTLQCLKMKYYDFPEMEHLVHEGKFYLAVRKYLRIFSDTNCKSLDVNAKFDAIIDGIVIHGNYMLLYARNGTIHLWDRTVFKTLFTSAVTTNVNFNEKYFINGFALNGPKSDVNVVSFLLVTKDGVLYSVSMNVENPDSVQMDLNKKAEFNAEIKVASYMENILLLNGEKCILHDFDNPDYRMSCDGLNLKTVYPYSDNQFIGLTTDGSLVYICAITLQVIPIETPDKYENLVFYISDSTAFVSCRNDGSGYVKLLNFSDATEIFSLTINDSIRLVASAYAYDEQLIIARNSDSSMRVMMVTETVPQKRLERLFKKRLYDEAEAFAIEHDLDIEDVKKARVSSYIDSPLSRPEDTAELIRMLGEISDVVFKLEVCQDVTCNTEESTLEMLKYGLSLNCGKTNKSEKLDVYFSRMNELMYKFDTYRMIMQFKRGSFDPEAWHEFNSSDLYQYFLQELKHKNIQVAIILFTRLDSEKLESLSTMDISNVFEILEKQSIKLYTAFLHFFIPKLIKHIPSSLPQLLKWTSERVFDIEKKNFNDFPYNANEFMKNVARLLNINPFLNNHLAEYCNNYEKQLEWMTYMMGCLNTIQEFKDNFKLLVPLHDCLKGPVSLVEALLCMDAFDVNDKLMDFLVQYLVKNNFEPNEIFVNVIQQLLTYDEKYWIIVIMPIWEKISSVKEKLSTLKLILESGNLPWCDTIKDMCKIAMSFDHELVTDIAMFLKMEPVYIVFSKYDMKSAKIENLTDMWAINRVIYLDAVEDAYTLCLDQDMRSNTTLLLLHKFIQKEDTTKAVDLFSQLTNEDVMSATSRFINMLRIILEQEDFLYKENQKNTTIQIAKLLLGRSRAIAGDEYEKRFNEEHFHKLECMHMLNKTYNLRYKYDELHKKREEIVDAVIINKIGQEYKRKTIEIGEVIKACRKYEEIFGMKKDEILMKISTKMNDTILLTAVAQYLYEYCEEPEVMIRMVFTILNKYTLNKCIDITDCLENLVDESVEDIQVTPEENLESIKECITACRMLAAKAVTLDSSNEAFIAFNWSEIFSFWDKPRSDSIQENTNIFTISTIETVCNFFYMFFRQASYKMGKKWKYNSLTENANISEEAISREIESMTPIYLERLSGDGNNLIACQLLDCYKHNLRLIGVNDPKISQFLYNCFFQRVKFLLECVFSSPVIDKELAFTLLTLTTSDKSIRIIKRALGVYMRTPEKATVVAELGIRVCNYYSTPSDKDIFCQVIRLEKWWKLNLNSIIPRKDFFCLPKNKLLERLIEGGLALVDVQKFCEDFKLDPQFHYDYYLNNMLMNWKPDYSVVKNARDEPCLFVKNNEEQLFSKCQEVIELIENKENVFTTVKNMWEKVNFYHYEVYMCILNIKAMLKPEKICNDRLLLLFLKGYRRVNKPKRNEIEEWFTQWPDTQNIDPISEWRLPFTPTLYTKNVWNILRPEVNINNFQKWFEVLPILTNLYKNDICSYAIKDLGNQLQEKSTGNPDEWCLHAQFTDLLEKADSCIQNIQNLEWATSVAYHLMTSIPKGADQVTAAKISYNYAKAYKNSPEFEDTPANQRAIVKLQNKFYSYSTLHILHANKLARSVYLDLVNQPNELIEALYSDECIIKRVDSVVFDCPDINKAVNEIAELYKINIQKKRLALLENWLNDTCSGTGANMDESIFLLPVVNSTNDSDVNLKKAIYICKSGNKEFWREYLFSKGTLDKPNFSNYYYQARALKCFCAISPIDVIENKSELTHKEMLNHIGKLMLMHDLQCLGMSVTHDSCTEYTNKLLLNKIQKNANRPQILKVITSICTFYEINDVKYWELIITNMIALKWYKELKVHILSLKNNCITYKDFYIKGWQTVIDYSFNSLQDDDEEYSYAMCVENMQLVQSCPVLNQINFKNVFTKCLQIKRAEFAALYLQYFPISEKKQMLKLLLQNTSVKALKESILKLNIGFGGIQVWNYIQEQTKCADGRGDAEYL